MMSKSKDSPTPQLRFLRTNRLLRRRSFLRVQHRGYRIDVGPLLAILLPAEEGRVRIGLTTSRRVGNAVFRNRVRRLIRESVRRLFLPQGWVFDIVFIVKRNLPQDIKQVDIDSAIESLNKQLLVKSDLILQKGLAHSQKKRKDHKKR